MKKVLFAIAIVSLIAITFSSCRSTRSGCYDTQHLVGYK